jgi:hypothetical protein
MMDENTKTALAREAAKGEFDVIAFNAWELLLVAVRKERWPPPAVRRKVAALADLAPFIRALAARVRRGVPEFRLVVDGDIEDDLFPWNPPPSQRGRERGILQSALPQKVLFRKDASTNPALSGSRERGDAWKAQKTKGMKT